MFFFLYFFGKYFAFFSEANLCTRTGNVTFEKQCLGVRILPRTGAQRKTGVSFSWVGVSPWRMAALKWREESQTVKVMGRPKVLWNLKVAAGFQIDSRAYGQRHAP